MNSVFSQTLSKVNNVVHAFLTRNFEGGLAETADHFGLKGIATLKQIHGDCVFLIKDEPSSDKGEKGDAIITGMRYLGVGVYTADCLPILLVDKDAKVVAVIHAGWKGTLLRILETTLVKMEKTFGIDPGNVYAAIGPSIGSCCYEVGEAVATKFIAKFKDCGLYLFKSNNSKYILDLREANRLSLIAAGVTEVEVIDICTKCNEDFHSFRREGKGVGKQLSLIGLV